MTDRRVFRVVLVTALFADINGSMDLMEEDLDSEEAQAIVDPALKLMMDAVHHYGGYVAQSTGDGIFALFGAPIAHEDHPQRALYAALKLQEEMRRYSAKLRAAGNLPLEARVGVNTGEVVVRSIVTGESCAHPLVPRSGSAATWMSDHAKPDAPAPGEPWADSEAPQSPQKLNEEVFSAPHRGHFADSADPHPPQNFFPAGFSVAHFEQRIRASLLLGFTAYEC